MKSMETACSELESVPYMGLRQAEIVKRIINEYKFKNALEIGFYHGKSSVLIASIFEEMGEGHLLTYDVESARDREPNIIQLLDAYNLSHRVTPVFCRRSYTWELAKLLKNSTGPVFDFCYLDGGHTWDCTGYGFFLIDLLLKPGGIIIFDDMDWTINTSPFYKKSLQEGKDPYMKYSDDEKNTPAVRMVFENLIPPRGYGRTEVKEVNWGIAIKL
ncbi:MAG: class I SAM-dependent methyltransferase [Deltaproteobacteria bacterium]|nr:class I SAM-dependent methyltransferase [Deltaproteobacteria bacterium]